MYRFTSTAYITTIYMYLYTYKHSTTYACICTQIKYRCLYAYFTLEWLDHMRMWARVDHWVKQKLVGKNSHWFTKDKGKPNQVVCLCGKETEWPHTENSYSPHNEYCWPLSTSDKETNTVDYKHKHTNVICWDSTLSVECACNMSKLETEWVLRITVCNIKVLMDILLTFTQLLNVLTGATTVYNIKVLIDIWACILLPYVLTGANCLILDINTLSNCFNIKCALDMNSVYTAALI